MSSIVQPLPFSLEDDTIGLGPFVDDQDDCFDGSYFTSSNNNTFSNAFSNTISLGKPLPKISLSEHVDDVMDFLSPSNNDSKPIDSFLTEQSEELKTSVMISNGSPEEFNSSSSLYTSSDYSYTSSPILPETPTGMRHSMYSLNFTNNKPPYLDDFQPPYSATPSSSNSITNQPSISNSTSPTLTSKELTFIKSHLSPELVLYLMNTAELSELQEKISTYVSNPQLLSKFKQQNSLFSQSNENFSQIEDPTTLLNLNQDNATDLISGLTTALTASDTTSTNASSATVSEGSAIENQQTMPLLNIDLTSLPLTDTNTNNNNSTNSFIQNFSNDNSIAPSTVSPTNTFVNIHSSSSFSQNELSNSSNFTNYHDNQSVSPKNTSSTSSSSSSANMKPVRKQSESRISLPELYQRMGLGHDHDTARIREQRILNILKEEGFRLGERTWIRDTSEKERRRIINEIYRQTFAEYQYPKEMIEVIVRRGSYYLMQGRLRRIRRGKKVVQTKMNQAQAQAHSQSQSQTQSQAQVGGSTIVPKSSSSDDNSHSLISFKPRVEIKDQKQLPISNSPSSSPSY